MSGTYGPFSVPVTPPTAMLTGVDPATLRLWLSQAQAAYAQLMSGAKVASASYAQGDGSKSVSYTPAQAPQLMAWIMQLQRALGVGGCRRPLRPFFS